jgi:large subunit ribosomal protein L7e
MTHISEQAKGPVVPEHVLKKRKTLEAVQADRLKKKAENRVQSKVQRGVIFKKAAKYAKEYRQKETDLVRLRREAKKHNNFFMEPEPKLVFVVRIRGINAVDPKTRKILQLMRLRQVKTHFLFPCTATSRAEQLFCCVTRS